MEPARVYDDQEQLSPEEWRRRQAAAIRVISQHIHDRGQRMEMLEILGLLPVSAERVA
jgi:hypothetical protein